jgi:hypothetical protein
VSHPFRFLLKHLDFSFWIFDHFLKQSNVSEEIFWNIFFWNNWCSRPLPLILEFYWLLKIR